MIDKEYLKRHLRHREALQAEYERYSAMSEQTPLRAINMDGMPHGNGASGDSAFFSTIEKVDTEKRIKELKFTIDRERAQIDALLNRLQYPIESKIIKMRYFQGMSWNEIKSAEYGRRADYYSNPAKYRDKVYKIHSSALRHIKELQQGK